MPTNATLDAEDASESRQGNPQQGLGDLLRRAGDQTRTAWDELVSRHRQLVARTARAVGLQPSDAADAVQLTWLRLLEHVQEIREPERLPGWLAVTARREALRIAVNTKRYTLCAEPETEYMSRRSLAVTDIYPVEGDYSPVIAAALAQLPPRYEKLIRLLMSDDCPSYTDVANQTGIPVGSIGPMRMRALHTLRQILGGADVTFASAGMAEVA